MENAFSFEVRPPWPDELWRLKRFLPAGFIHDATPLLEVAVDGPSERFAGALSLSMAPLRHQRAGLVALRVDEHPRRPLIVEALMRPALEAAWEAGARAVSLGRSFATDSQIGLALRKMGFEEHEALDLYEAPVEAYWPRLQRIHKRFREQNWIPPGVQLTTLLPEVIVEARRFLLEHLPHSVSSLALESAGYKPEHSLALWLDGEIKGVWLCRRVGKVALTGLRLVAPELRGGLGWANFLLLYASVEEAVRNGMELSRFELNPALHDDTRQMAETLGARLIGHIAFFRINNPFAPNDTTQM